LSTDQKPTRTDEFRCVVPLDSVGRDRSQQLPRLSDSRLYSRTTDSTQAHLQPPIGFERLEDWWLELTRRQLGYRYRRQGGRSPRFRRRQRFHHHSRETSSLRAGGLRRASTGGVPDGQWSTVDTRTASTDSFVSSLSV